MAQHNDTGKWGEAVAVDYLRRKGYTIRHTNWRSKHREIDIVALADDMRTLVFVEVKTRESNPMVAPEVAIDEQKIRNIGYAANSYVQQFRIMNDLRFDIITVEGTDDGGTPLVRHWEDAFNPMLIF